MKVKDLVMLLMAEQIAYIRRTETFSLEEAYNKTLSIARIYCNDGTSFSAQCHPCCHSQFKDVETDSLGYSLNFGECLLGVETDANDDELNIVQFAYSDIDDVEEYATKHGGIDFERTSLEAVQRALS